MVSFWKMSDIVWRKVPIWGKVGSKKSEFWPHSSQQNRTKPDKIGNWILKRHLPKFSYYILIFPNKSKTNFDASPHTRWQFGFGFHRKASEAKWHVVHRIHHRELLRLWLLLSECGLMYTNVILPATNHICWTAEEAPALVVVISYEHTSSHLSSLGIAMCPVASTAHAFP